ncbi:MAG: ribosome biogenesis GTPase YlqF [Clostridia bacterium]|nr:ribosome biogenesis GTPase YlqF [Clostridia bacterium]
MKIQWFPGHMTKALREMEKNIKAVDVIIYVLDARAPYSCLNPKFEEILGRRPVVFVLNKADLADEKETKLWQAYFSRNNNICITLNSTMTGSGKTIISAINTLAHKKLNKYANKGVNITLRAMVIGVPNCGKSTLINNLSGKYKAKTGDKPSITRNTQWVKLDNMIELLDTPGTLWPDFNDKVATNLAIINSIKDDVVDQGELSVDFIKFALQYYKTEFLSRYDLADEDITPPEYLEKICERRKFLLKGDYDYERGARAVLDDFRKCRIGRITIDRYENIVRE